MLNDLRVTLDIARERSAQRKILLKSSRSASKIMKIMTFGILSKVGSHMANFEHAELELQRSYRPETFTIRREIIHSIRENSSELKRTCGF